MAMHDPSFLPHFITEDIYVIEEESGPANETKPQIEKEPPAVETSQVAEPAPVVEPTQVAEPEPVIGSPKPLPTLGKNLKNCLIFVASDDEVIGQDDLNFLLSILKAIKLAQEDVLIANVKEASGEQIAALMEEQSHRQLLSFGFSGLDQLAATTHYEISTVGHRSYLKADPLTAISADVEKKKALWKALQSMFLNK